MCRRERDRARYAKLSPEAKKAVYRTQRKKHSKQAAKRNKQYRKNLKLLVIREYGGECTCPGCDVRHPAFLTIDHVNGRRDEGRTKKDTHNSYDLALRVKREGFPDTYTVLCFNCNSGRALNGGVCPHQSKDTV